MPFGPSSSGILDALDTRTNINMGRPLSFTSAVGEEICERLMQGRSLRQICADPEMPDRTTVVRWLAREEDFAAKYARARDVYADVMEEDMAEIEDRTLSGEIEPAAARVVLTSKQWRAAKLAPKKYGDRLDLNHSGQVKVAKELSETELAEIASSYQAATKVSKNTA